MDPLSSIFGRDRALLPATVRTELEHRRGVVAAIWQGSAFVSAAILILLANG